MLPWEALILAVVASSAYRSGHACAHKANSATLSTLGRTLLRDSNDVFKESAVTEGAGSVDVLSDLGDAGAGSLMKSIGTEAWDLGAVGGCNGAGGVEGSPRTCKGRSLKLRFL